MRMLNLTELLTVTATPRAAFKSMRARDQLAFAFARRYAYETSDYLEVDAVGFLLADTLAQSYDRETAAHLTRIHFDLWGCAVAAADTDPSRARNFCIVDFVMADGKKAHLACAPDHGDVDQIALEVSATPQAHDAEAERVTCINVTRLMKFIRQTGAAHDIDLSRPFLPPPDHPAFAELLAPYIDARNAAISQVRTLTPRGREKLAERTGDIARKIAERHVTGTLQ